MTRINCVPVKELTDKHLLAEYRELPRISKLAKYVDIPSTYRMGKGHVTFFYDKGEYLRRRFEDEIVPELELRGFTVKYKIYRKHPAGLNKDWTPTQEAMTINRQRIQERLMNKQAGFTLIEMLVTLAMVAALYTIAMPKINYFIDKANYHASQVEMRTIKICILSYEIDNASLPNNLKQIKSCVDVPKGKYKYKKNQRKLCINKDCIKF